MRFSREQVSWEACVPDLVAGISRPRLLEGLRSIFLGPGRVVVSLVSVGVLAGGLLGG
jgi:hypothetical protein